MRVHFTIRKEPFFHCLLSSAFLATSKSNISSNILEGGGYLLIAFLPLCQKRICPKALVSLQIVFEWSCCNHHSYLRSSSSLCELIMTRFETSVENPGARQDWAMNPNFNSFRQTAWSSRRQSQPAKRNIQLIFLNSYHTWTQKGPEKTHPPPP